ncbi:hypothetical protein [Flavobacterium sp. N2270]|uniref:hypothetical protein n=1 Tax=Flavobacterium sp. N2270 TaxID=2986831 RepID=UPI0022251648|nr:hypothetical protein [Flavobacterium sp. N2270]
MFFSIFSSIIFVFILFIFSKFLDKIIDFQKANILIYSYIVFTFLSTISIILVLVSSLKVYSQQNDVDSLMNFADTSSSSAVFLILSRIGLFFTAILLGNRIRKITTNISLMFKTLGLLLIVYKLFALLESINIIKTEIISGFVNVAIVAIIGYILSLKFENKENENNSFEPSISETTTRNKEILLHELENDYSTLQSHNDSFKENDSIEIKNIEVEKEDLNPLEYKNEAVNYYNNLTNEEKTRLNYIITKKNDSISSENEIYKLVILYIIEKKLFDNNRFAPK